MVFSPAEVRRFWRQWWRVRCWQARFRLRRPPIRRRCRQGLRSLRRGFARVLRCCRYSAGFADALPWLPMPRQWHGWMRRAVSTGRAR